MKNDQHMPVHVGHSISHLNADIDLIASFLERYDKESTVRTYKTDLLHFFGLSKVDLKTAASVSFSEINKYIIYLEEKGYKASTIKRRMATIKGFYKWLTALGLIQTNPASDILLRRVQRSSKTDRPILFLSRQQALDLLAASTTNGRAAVRDHALLNVLLHCVLRRSEAAAMDVEHIRPLGHYWILDLPNTKGGADQYVKIPADLVEEIDEMRSHYKIESGSLWNSLSNNGYGRRLSPHSIYRIVQKTAQKAGLSGIGAHTLRHTGCTLAIESGASLQQVQTHARHKNIETTMVYIHQRDRLRDSAADFIHLKK